MNEKLEQTIEERGKSIGRGAVEIQRLIQLSRRFEDVRAREVIVIPPPQVDIDGGDFELAWFRLKTQRSVSFAYEGDQLVAVWMDGRKDGEVVAPSDDFIAEKMRWIMEDPGDIV